jgi:AraC family transcriptional regulator
MRTGAWDGFQLGYISKEVAMVEWLERMSEAVAYMEANLTHEVDMAEVATRAYSSSFHFQRMFHMLTDMTVAEYIRKRRLTMVAQELVMTSPRVLDISLKYGYDSPKSVARAVRKVHGLRAISGWSSKPSFASPFIYL